MNDITTIVIERETRDKLKKIGKKGETYNDIIKRLIENNETKQYYRNGFWIETDAAPPLMRD